MALYMEYSTRIYQIYLKHVAPEDIHVYSVDEVFIDATPYLHSFGYTAEEFARTIIRDVLDTTGITATAGIGTNLYLCKVALDIMAKHAEADENGVRVGALNEQSYRRLLWDHRPITDFWRVGRGYAKTLEQHGIYTMGDVAKCSVGDINDYYNEDLLYRLFGVNAELLIDHAWGWEPCEIRDIKSYRPESNSLGSGQVLKTPYPFEKAKLVAREMTDLLTLELVDQGLVTDQIVLTVGYDVENLTDPKQALGYRGAVSEDHYGRKIPKPAHGTVTLSGHISSSRRIVEEVMALFDRIVNQKLTVRRLNVTANHVIPEGMAKASSTEGEQLSLFTDYEGEARKKEEEMAALEKERKMQKAMIVIKKKYGKNAILKGMNLEEGATAKDRNRQIGGHRA
jgi:DNA polymerase V